MIVKDMIDHIVNRVGKKILEDHGPKFIISLMNERYHYYNRKYKGAITEEWELSFDDDATDFSADLPDRFLEPYYIDPLAYWRPVKVFNDSEAGTFTIDPGLKKIYFVNANGQTFNIKYWSIGKTLVDKETASLQDGEINEPEWPDDLHWLLVIDIATHLSNEYPLYKQDLYDLEDYKKQLRKLRISQNAANPIITGPGPRRSSVSNDAYEGGRTHYFV